MSLIEWTDVTWNPVLGCSRVSPGCDNCYAIGTAHRKMQPSHVGLTKMRPKNAARPGMDWTGVVRCLPERLARPLPWRKPRRIFVNSMSDLFHPAVPFEFIAAVLGVIASKPSHTFLVLTKRDPRPFFAWVCEQAATPKYRTTSCPEGFVIMDAAAVHVPLGLGGPGPWPLPNLHLGVSAEGAATFAERVPWLLESPAAVRWVSAEPLIGPLGDLCPWLPHAFNREPHCEWCEDCVSPGPTERWQRTRADNHGAFLDWVVVGGESGPGARACNVDWLRSVVRQCHEAGVPVFVKQLGAMYEDPANGIAGAAVKDPELMRVTRLVSRKGSDPTEWPIGLRVREYPAGYPAADSPKDGAA